MKKLIVFFFVLTCVFCFFQAAITPLQAQQVLYDNGQLVTHPGGGAGGADASAVQTALSLNTYGWTDSVALGYRLTDDLP